MSAVEIAPTVCLDGPALRRIREEKKLTQLYVAKVVGVTTDTVSRWENNRYPSVRKDNALRLAEALDVPVQLILRECPPDAPPAPPSPRTRFLPVVVVILLLLLALVIYQYGRRATPLSSADIIATRLLSQYAAPGNVVPVRIWIETDQIDSKGFIVREQFPSGWKLIEAFPPASSLDNESGMARWLLKPGENRLLISYLLRVSAEAPIGQEGHFAGEVVVSSNGRNLPTSLRGDQQMKIAPYQWADYDGDFSIDDSEMLHASDVVEEMRGVHIDWKLLEKIWDAGSYSWDEEGQRFLPRKTPSSPAAN